LREVFNAEEVPLVLVLALVFVLALAESTF